MTGLFNPEREKDRAKLRLIRITKARENAAAFAAFVLRDEETGKPVTLAPMHRRWHRLLDKQPRLVIWGHPESGKSAQVAVARVLWELGRNPNLRIVVISATEKLAKKLISTVRQYIEKSAELHTVFPDLRARAQKAGQPWSMTALTVERSVISKDPSLQAVGIAGNILGSRIDVLIFDDILTRPNTRTEAKLAETFDWLTGTPLGRLTSGARVWAVTNAWNPHDAMERLVAERGFKGVRFPVLLPDGTPAWPDRFPPKRLRRIRRDLGAVEYARQMLCIARDESEARFKREWIEVGLKRGAGYSLVNRVDPDDLPNGYAIFHGVDLAVSLKTSADLTVFFTILLHPNGDRQVLSIIAGRWSGPDIVERVDDLAARYGGLFIVENNAAQQFILQFAAETTRAQLKAFTTGHNKADPAFGVESLATELEAGWWIIPSPEDRGDPLPPEVEAWVSEMVGYDPRPGKHTGDRIMSSWFAREGARTFERRHHRGRKRGASVAEIRTEKASGGVRIIGGS